MAKWRAAASSPWPVYHGGVLYFVCDRQCYLCDVVYFVSWSNWITIMICSCGSAFICDRIKEWDDGQPFIGYTCPDCGYEFGIEADAQDVSPLFENPVWTDEAQHCLERLPPYIEPMVRQEVESYAEQKRIMLISSGLITEARNQGAVVWHPDAEQRLSRVPSPVRAMARVELERTALDRGMPEVTVALMEEIKARYFGMAAK